MQVHYEKLTLNEKSAFLYKDVIQMTFSSPLHWHDEYELIYIKRGQGKLITGNRVSNFNTGELYFFAPALPHCFINSPEKGKKAHAIVIQFRYNFLGEEIWKKNETDKLKKLLKKTEGGLMIKQANENFVNQFISLGKINGLKRITSLLELLDSLSNMKNISGLTLKNNFEIMNETGSEIISKVYRYVAENFTKDISLEKAASTAHMQKSAFCRYFKRRTQKNFSNFVNEIRITHALKLLSETDKAVLEICYDCGYKSLSYFNRQFKLMIGLTPFSYRKSF